MDILVSPHNKQEEKVLLAFLDSLKYDYSDAGLNIPPPYDEKKQTIDEYNQDIAEAEAEYEKGESIPVDELKRKMRSW